MRGMQTVKRIKEQTKKLSGRKLKYLIGSLVIIALLIAGSIFLDQDEKPAVSAQNLTVEAERGSIISSIKQTGTVSAADRKVLTSETSGVVKSINVGEGDFVKAGDLLVVLGGSTGSTQDRRAQIDWEIAQNQLHQLLEEQRNLNVYAPVSGVVGDGLPAVGTKLSKGYRLTTITDQSVLKVQASFNSRVEAGDKAELFFMEYLKTYEGRVVSASQIRSSSGATMYNAVITMKNPGRMGPGQEARVAVNREGGLVQAVTNPLTEWGEQRTVELEVAGTLERLLVSSGDWVEKGQLIAVLSNDELALQIKNQELKAEQARLEAEGHNLYAPIDGTILTINVAEGEEILSKSSILTMADISTMKINLAIDELDIYKLKPGQQANVFSEALPGQVFKAHITKISLEGTQNNGITTFDVELELEKQDILKVGMSVEVEILVAEKKDVIVIPIAAVQDRGNKKYVLLVNEKNPEEPVMREVVTGLANENFVEIVSGLNEGDLIQYTVAGNNQGAYQRMQRMPGPPGMGGGVRVYQSRPR